MSNNKKVVALLAKILCGSLAALALLLCAACPNNN